MARRDRGHEATFDGFVSQLARCPVADGAPRVGRGLTGQRHNLAPLLDAERHGCPWARSILEPFWHRTSGPRQPVATPAPDREATGPQEPSDLVGIVPIREVQNNLRTE